MILTRCLGASDRSKRPAGKAARRIVELRVIEDVERFPSELELAAIGTQPEDFEERHIEVVDPGPVPQIPRRVTECAWRRYREARGVEITKTCPLVTRQLTIAETIGGDKLRVHIRDAGSYGHAEWHALGKDSDAVHLPAAHDGIDETARIRKESLAASERQLDAITRNEAMSHIERRQTAVRLRVARRFDGVAANVGAGVQRFAPCVRKEEVIPRREALLQLCRQSVVTGVTHTIKHVDRSEVGVRPAALQRLILEGYVRVRQPGLIVVRETQACDAIGCPYSPLPSRDWSQGFVEY